MTPEDMDLLAALGRARAGVRIETEKPYLIESRLAPLARRESYDSIDALIAALRSKREERLIWAVVEALCRSETRFFRGRETFAQLRDQVLPALSQRRRETPIRIWSAACATGQEVYSMAIAAAEAPGLFPGARFEFFGSDLSERSLEKAQAGIYTQFEVQRGLPIRLLIKYFESQDDTWAISPRIRQMVRWKRINLLADLSAMGRFDVILLRNVLGGMEASLRGKVARALAALLPDEAEKVDGDRTVTVSPADLHVGDLVIVRPGGSVPADGRIVDGRADMDESMITGESRPVSRGVGDSVTAGTVATDSGLRVEITATGDDTALAGIQRLVTEAQNSSSRAQRLADRAAGWLFWFALVTAAVTAIAWAIIGDPDTAVVRAITVLVIACPHALGLAIPLVISLSTAVAARNGDQGGGLVRLSNREQQKSGRGNGCEDTRTGLGSRR